MIALYIFAGAWAIFIMVWKWWYETAPRIEAQRMARVALASVIDGTIDSTAGTDVIDSAAYNRRNGIEWAVSFDIPAGENGKRIDFGLPQDGVGSNVRSFYLGTDEASGLNVVYYKDNNAALHRIRPTLGMTDLKFEKYTDAGGSVYDDIVKVTATVDKTVTGTRQGDYAIEVKHSDTVFLNNV